MTTKSCAMCSFRQRYENNPKSLLGRAWRWHIGWCPGWKSYMAGLPQRERNALTEQILELDHMRKV